jgi:hypothetical protein
MSATETATVPAEHPAWPRLTDDQRKSINELWDEMVVPALARTPKRPTPAYPTPALRRRTRGLRPGTGASSTTDCVGR